ncbi:MAG: DEAD/DEAH box helicase, partial [Gemmatimonadales bacterium]
GRGLIDQGRLTAYGREVEALPVERPWGELLVQGDSELLPVLAASANIDSLHRMTRDERDLGGVVVKGSDHLTAYNLFAEAVNKHGFLGEVYGLPRHLFDEGLDDWAERRGVLIRAIEDIALGMAAVYRALEQPLPRQLPYAGREVQHGFSDLLARVMPFDLVIDEHTADGQEARVSRTSVAGSWGAVAGSLRFFSDRFGVARAGIEGTTLSYDLIRRHARQGPPRIELRGSRRHQRPVAVRRLDYFGFELETVAEELEGVVPEELRPAFADALAQALAAGDTVHPNQARLSRALEEAGELHRRSGGRLAGLSEEALRTGLRAAVEGMSTWEEFLATRIQFDPVAEVPLEQREQLAALPSSLRLLGDQVPLDYEIERGEGVVRLRLREGQARRLRQEELPTLDRPIRYGVMRGRDPELRAETLEELRQLLLRAPGAQRRRREFRPPRHRRR